MADPAYNYDKAQNEEKRDELLQEVKVSYKEFKTWEFKNGERAELIYGIAYAMSSPGTEHQRISMSLSGILFQFLKDKTCHVFAAPYDVRLFYKEDESDDTVVQPDLIIVCDSKKLGKEGCHGAPDLVIEILSPSNTAMEMNRKKNLYLKAAVPEFWIVDPEIGQVEVNRPEEDRYVPYTFQKGDTLKSFFFDDFFLNLDELFS